VYGDVSWLESCKSLLGEELEGTWRTKVLVRTRQTSIRKVAVSASLSSAFDISSPVHGMVSRSASTADLVRYINGEDDCQERTQGGVAQTVLEFEHGVRVRVSSMGI
jgi:hypothetical protein